MRVFGALTRAVHVIAQDGARELRGHGLTPAQYQVLVMVDAMPGRRQHELGAALDVTKGNISMLVTRLEDAGLLTRVPEGAAFALHVTAAGAETVARLRPEHSRFMAERFAVLGDDELATLEHLVTRLGGS